MREIKKIVLHHSACENTFEQIRDFHINTKGWSDIFYHYVIDVHGFLRVGRAIDRKATHERDDAIEICIIGRLHKRKIYERQHITLLELIKSIHFDYGLVDIYGHNDFSPTICPGSLDVDKYIEFIQELEKNEKDEYDDDDDDVLTKIEHEKILKRLSAIENHLSRFERG